MKRTKTQAIKTSVSRTIEADPAFVWSVLGDFGTEHRWASQLSHCCRSTETVHVGTVRSCTLTKPIMGRSAVDEELIEFDPGKGLSYRLRGGAGPFRCAEGRWTIRPVATGTLVEVFGRFEPRCALFSFFFGGLARAAATRAAQRAVDDLSTFIEAR
jgi:uncharacterized protein YndB with AHSA1/START domain